MPPAAYIRSLNPDLPRPVWLLQAGGLANMFGNGVIVPFLVIYLHNVRGISLGLAGSIAAANGLAALVSGPIAGALADRIGARTTLVGALLVMSVAFSLFPLIHEAWHAFLLGGLTGGLIASTSNPSSFTLLFLVDAATFLVFALILTRVPSAKAPPAHEQERAGYRAVFANRPFVAFILLNTAFIAASIALFSELFPVFAKNQAGVSERGIGLIFFLNTLLIVLIQLPVAKFQQGKRRMAALATMGVLWSATWVLVLAGGLWLEGAAATALFAVAFAVFAVGECLHGTVQGPLVSDLAPRHLLGRYMALSSSSWQVGFIIGPAAGGFVLQAQPYALWPVAAAVCLAGGAWALMLERRLPAHVRATPEDVEEEVKILAPAEPLEASG